MKLETAASQGLAEVSAQQLREAFADDKGRGEFVILSQQPEVYIRAAGEAEGPYSLEYRDGDEDHHFSAGDAFRKEDVLRAFLWYLAGDARWRSEFPWQKLEHGPGIQTTVASPRSAYLRWRKRIAWSLGSWLMVGTVVGLGIWFAQAPRDRDEVHFGGAVAMAVSVFFIGCLLGRMFLPKPKARCPDCGYDWQGSDTTDDWLAWKCCPGCGLKMN
jgi:hypothetical protein